MEKIKFTKYESASTYIKKKYKASGLLMGLGAVSMNKMFFIKEGLLREHTLGELRIIKASANAQMDTYKQLNLYFTTLCFFVTSLSVPMVFYIQSSMKMVDWEYEIYKSKIDDQLTNIPIEEKISFLTNKKQLFIDSFGKTLTSISDSHFNLLGFLLIVIVLFVMWYIGRYMWMSRVNNIINEAFEEAKENK